MPVLLPRPRAADAASAERGLGRWRRVAETSADPGLAAFVRASLADTGLRELLEGIFGGSPFLTDCLTVEPGVLRLLQEEGAAQAHEILLRELDEVRTAE